MLSTVREVWRPTSPQTLSVPRWTHDGGEHREPVSDVPREGAPPVSIRERVQAIGTAMISDDPAPALLRKHEVMLSGLLSHINKAVTGAEIAYKKKLAELRGQCKTAAEAKMQAEATQEFADWLEAEATKDSAMEMLRTFRSTLKSVSDEMRMQR